MRTHASTVGALLTERGLKLGTGDVVQPAVTTPIVANMQIFVLRKGQKIVTEETTQPMETQIIEDSSLTFGTTAVRQVGSDGKKLITYLIDTQNGVETRKVIQEVVTQQAVPQIIARGKAVQIPSDKQAVMAAAGISSSDYAYVDYIVSHESGWCPTKLQGQAGYCPPYAPADVPSYLGYGLGQATPGSKMASFGSDWQTNPVTQLRWATSYAVGRYGSWGAAYNHWFNSHNW
jgi:glutaredoxin